MLPADERLDAREAARRPGRRSAGRRAEAGRARPRAGAGRPARGARGSPRACPGSKTAKPALPLALAMYIATSALRTRSAALSVCVAGARDADARGDHDRLLADQVRRPQLARQPLGHRQRPLEVGRVARSGSRTRRRRGGRRGRRPGPMPRCRSVTACSSASPAAWPSVSLTTLKSSRSMNRTAVIVSAVPQGTVVEDALEADLEHAAVGGAGQRVALGQVLDVAEQDGVAQVQRGHRAQLAERRSRPAARRRRSARDGCSTTIAPTGRPSAIIGATSRFARVGHHRGEERVERRLEAADGEDLASLPGAARRSSRAPRRRSATAIDATRGEDDHPVVRRAEDDAALEPEPVDEAVEHDPRLAHRVAHVVEPGADVDQRLEVRAALAQLALVHRREDRRGEREQPERRRR